MQLNNLLHKQMKYCQKLTHLNNKWHIPPPSSSSSFEVSAILRDCNFDDIRVYGKGGQSTI